MIVYGEGALTGQGAAALLNLAGHLGLRGRDGAGLLEIPSSANGRGLREAGLAPGHGPGYAPLENSTGRDAPGIAAALAAGELSTVWLQNVDPIRAYPDRALWERALGAANTVIAVDTVLTDSLREHADVVFPGEAYAEKEGTLVHPDGRVQRLRPAIGRPRARNLRESGSPDGVRAGWQVIAEVADRAGVEIRALSASMVSQMLFDAVPFFAGLTLDEIGGRGVRWPQTEAGLAWSAGEWQDATLSVPAGGADGQRAPAARHLPHPVGLQGGRRLAGAALPARPPGRRALARGRRRPRDPRGRPRLGGRRRDAGPGRRQAARRDPERVGLRRARHRGAAGERAHRGPRRRPQGRRRGDQRRERRGRAGDAGGRGARRGARLRAAEHPADAGSRGMIATVGFYEPWWMQILKALAIFAVVFNLVPIALLADRKVLGRFQHRYGPNRVGPFGVLQAIADIGKLVFKEQFRPRTSTGWLFALAPAISMITAAATIAIIPFSNVVDIFGTPTGLYGVDPSIGILFAFAFGGIAFYGLMLGGWASGSKYSFLGSMRAAAQLISYEVAQGLSVIGVVMMTGSLSMTKIVAYQEHHLWFIIPQFVGFLIFMVAGFAETNRAPFDLAEADAELVGGYNTEYGGGPLRRVLRGRVPEHGRRLRPDHDAVPGRVGHPVRRPAALGRPDRRDREDVRLPLLLHLGAGDVAAAQVRPADELRLEDPAAAGDPQRARDRDPGGGDMTYDPGADVIEVQRAPRATAAAGTYRAFGATLKGLKTTFARMVEGPTTIQYPEEKTPVYPRFRGRHKLHRFEDTGLEKCVGCSLCAAACPADCIRVVAAENTPENRVSAGERYAAVYEINLSRCIFCGYCEIACPFDAITMGHDYEMADYDRSDLIFTKEMLLAEPLDRTPAAVGRRVASHAACRRSSSSSPRSAP